MFMARPPYPFQGDRRIGAPKLFYVASTLSKHVFDAVLPNGGTNLSKYDGLLERTKFILDNLMDILLLSLYVHFEIYGTISVYPLAKRSMINELCDGPLAQLARAGDS